jgi:hypothetical protein
MELRQVAIAGVRARASLGLRFAAFVLVLASVVVACSSNNASVTASELAAGCIIDSDCRAPLVCAFKTCHDQCTVSEGGSSPDCPSGQLCVASDRPYHVCQVIVGCSLNSDCPSPLVCGRDLECRDQCASARDCVAGDVCADGTCVATTDPDYVDGGLLQGDSSANANVGTPCTLNSDCPTTLICVNSMCTPQCREDRDCAGGQSCVQNACVSPDAGNSTPDANDANLNDAGDATLGNDASALPGHCSDGTEDDGETDVDCGGTCAPCLASHGCTSGSDCASGNCVGSICQTPTCSDGIANGVESDIDCGGANCVPCAVGKDCHVASDCTTAVCVASICRAPSCTDGQKNGAETDVDCGGGTCPKCDFKRACSVASDCTSGACTNAICQSPTCTDNMKDGTETSIDCGGAACAPCGTGATCALTSDCASSVCTMTVCQAPSCSDGIKNGTESDIDCGGTCSGCAAGKSCTRLTDCASSVCNSGACSAAYVLNVVRQGSGSGTVDALPEINCGGTCSANVIAGTQVVLSATPDSGATFTGWSGACTGTGTCVVTMSANTTVVATFGGGSSAPSGIWVEEPVAGQYQEVSGVASDAQGNVISIGYTYWNTSIDFGLGAVSFPNSTYRTFVLKYPAAGGKPTWVRTFGAGGDYVLGLAVRADAAGDVYASGSYSSTPPELGGPVLPCGATPYSARYGWMAKYSGANGGYLWGTCFQGPNPYTDSTAYAAAPDANGNVVVVGRQEGPTTFSSSITLTMDGSSYPTGPYVAKLSASTGAVTWAESFQVTGGDGLAENVAVDGAGNIFVCGDFQSQINFGGGVRTSNGGYDIFVAEFTPSGTYVWDRTYGGTQDDHCTGIGLDASGNVAWSGDFQSQLALGNGQPTLSSAGGSDALIVEVDGAGNPRWGARVGGTGNDTNAEVAVLPNGNVVLTASIASAVSVGSYSLGWSGGLDIALVRYDSNGNVLSAASYGSPQNEQPFAIAAIPFGGRVAIGGVSYGPTVFGPGALTLATGDGSGELFTAVLQP